ncbi:Sec23-binding domain of Sec16-domain-containing protein [Calycina marina]|uniref:Protein transport protein sec16 n=1 Tax=Calycina marina TaxID=1763456 RepID=A0A9P7Z175_9HELO|nr:Sec23-binding domain of Sec16-domain-containing protein [Calycina marina]
MATSEASWHPAFMPNSITIGRDSQEILQTYEPPSQASTLTTIHASAKPLIGIPEQTEDALVVDAHGIDAQYIASSSEDTRAVARRDEEELEDTSVNYSVFDRPEDAHVPMLPLRDDSIELEKLRNAFTTVLATPGGVEMDESPEHTGEAFHTIEQDYKAEFPSEGPTPSKHTSSMSFSRTVSDDVHGADEEEDKVPEMRAMEPDPFEDMAKSDRSNSFPHVPAAHATSTNVQPLPTEVGEIIKEAEQAPLDLFADDIAADDDFFIQTAAISAPEQRFPISQQEPEFEEARFEEGLPLVEAEQTPAKTPAADPFSIEGEGGEEDDFYSQVGQNESDQFSPPQLERKSTVQVMNNIHFDPQIEDTIEEDEPQTPLEKATGGGIVASKSTIASALFGEYEEEAPLKAENSEDDLAAKWKAALDGDEFLDDDDLLLEDEAHVKSQFDPAELFGSDDEGFLDDIEEKNTSSNSSAQPHNTIAPVLGSYGQVVGFNDLTSLGQNIRPAAAVHPSSSCNRSMPTGQAMIPQPSNPFAPAGPQFTNLSSPITEGAVQPSIYGAPMTNFQPQSQPSRPDIPKAQSFANQAKGGYSSPYDLPMDVLPARKRPSMAQIRSTPAAVAPPRSSSMNSPIAPPPNQVSTPGLPPPQSIGLTAVPLASKPPPILKSKSSFFEELPMVSRPKILPRHTTSQGLQSQHKQTLGLPSLSPLPPHTSYAAPGQQSPQAPSYTQGLVAPERISPYASLLASAMPIQPAASRYSPAPLQPSTQTIPLSVVSQARYSPAPPPRAVSYNDAPLMPPQPPFLPHQPRTSSPLVQFSHGHHGAADRRTSDSYESAVRPSQLPPPREIDEDMAFNGGAQFEDLIPRPHYTNRFSQTPPPQQGLSAKPVHSPPKRIVSNYLPQAQKTSPPQSFPQPKRSQTSSPGAYSGRVAINQSEIYQRPASTEAPESPRSHVSTQMPVNRTRPRGFSHGVTYIEPMDGRESDPLKRWKGSPVFAWGVGGTVITSFPKNVPRYGAHQTMPMMLRSPGEVKIQSIKYIDPLSERLSNFPGPLKGKSKKKDTVAWLTSGIDILEKNASYLRTISVLKHDDKRTEERILLWKILRVFIDNDGILEGNSVVDKAVRAVLSPGLDDEVLPGIAPLYATGADLSGISHSATNVPRAEAVDPTAVDQLRKHLLRGEREKAIWDAVDKRLWAHAMLISNTVSGELYKQVCQEFVQKEVKNIGDNTESLAALYEIFAGNLEESIDELVPPSARAGFQMMNTSGSGAPSKDALDGLDRWRETLGLVLSNRSVDDNQALNALGKLLSGYGRAEAAHICFMFARSHALFAGVDVPATSMVLVGSDHLRQPFEFDTEMEPILLSEVFEYGMSLSSTSALTASSPHLSVYKLQHALILAESGFREKALEYCESIASLMYSATRKSPYHHNLLASQVEDLTKRLKQSPKDPKSSWIPKPTVSKVSNSLFSSFNKFVAGEDNDAGTPDSAANGEAGPFARISGTPTISRSPSSVDVYGSYNGSMPINGAMPPTTFGGKYAPGASCTPPGHDLQHGGSSYGSQPRTSFEGRSSGEYRQNAYEPVRQGSDHMPPPQNTGNNTYMANFSPSYSAAAYAFSPQGSGFHTDVQPQHAPQKPQVPQQASSLYSPHQNSSESPPMSAYAPFTQQELSQSANNGTVTNNSVDKQPTPTTYEPLAFSSYEPPMSNYQPYEPPAYVPDTMIDEDSLVDTKSKKKAFMDEDNDNFKPMSAPPASISVEKTKAEKDHEVDEAFRKAAEADTASAKEAASAPKKGWGLGGWFAKKDPGTDTAPSNKPIKAKLGEQNSFVYDEASKRWVNKKGGAAENTPVASATPPPPRASGPPRPVSAANPSLGPISIPRMPPPATRNTSGLSDGSVDIQLPSSSGPPASAPTGMPLVAAPLAMSRQASNGTAVAGSGPPSRPGTSISNVSSIDDLLGAAAPRKAGERAAKGKKKGRGYIDLMQDKIKPADG